MSFVFMATAVASAVSMSIDSLNGPVTQNEINSFITFMQSQTPPPTPWGALNGTGHNDWADGTAGRQLEAMGEMFEVSSNMTILNQMVNWSDYCTSQRNDLMSVTNGGQRVLWTGLIDKVWMPNWLTDGTYGQSNYCGCETEDLIGHLAYCSKLILQTPAIWNLTVPDGDPFGYGATYFQRATNYLAKCDEANDEYFLKLFIQPNTYLIRPPSDTAWTDLHENVTANNRQMMFTSGFQRLAEAHELLGDDPARVALYDAIVKASTTECLNGMINYPGNPRTANGQAVYEWGYYPTSTSGVETTEIHAEYDMIGAWRAFSRPSYGFTRAPLIPFANTLVNVVYLGTNTFAVNVDGSGGIQNGIYEGWLWTADWNPKVYDVLAAAMITNGWVKYHADNDAAILYMKDRRYREFSVTPSPATRTVNAGAQTTFALAVAPLGGFSNSVSLAANNLPSGATANFSLNSVDCSELALSATNVTLSIQTAAATPRGTYSIPIVGTSGGVSHTNVVHLVVNSPAGSWTTINDTNAAITYSGNWNHSGGRNVGDYDNDVHYTKTNGDYAEFTFTGTGIEYLAETYSDEGNVDIYLDGAFQTAVNCNTLDRQSQVVAYSNTGLMSGTHTIRIVKSSGKYLLLDAFASISEPPIAPMGVAAIAGNGRVLLNWNAVAGVTGYNVKRAVVSGGPYTPIASPVSPTFTDTDVTNGRAYFYVVSATNAVGESTDSDQASATPFDAASVNLVGHYTFDDGTASDSSGFGNDGMLNGGASIVTDTQRGQVLSLDGSSGYVDIGNASSLNLSVSGQATIAAWVKVTQTAIHNAILSKGEWKEAYSLLVKGDSSPVNELFTGNDTAVLSGNAVSLNTWTHVAVTINGSLTCFYINGQLSGATNQDRGNPIDQTSTDVCIGREQYSGSMPAGRWFFHGQMDDVRIYNKALTQSEIQNAISNVAPDTAPAFNEHPIAMANATAEKAFANTLAGSASDPDPGDTLLYSKVNGPAWLNINSSGVLSGTPAQADAGTNSFIVRVTDSEAFFDEAELNINVIPASPNVTGIDRAGGDLVLIGSNGVPDRTYYVLSSTNLELPTESWTRLLTNTFDSNGAFEFSQPLNSDAPKQFFLLQVQ